MEVGGEEGRGEEGSAVPGLGTRKQCEKRDGKIAEWETERGGTEGEGEWSGPERPLHLRNGDGDGLGFPH